MSLVASLDRSFYPGVQNFWDDKAFRAFVLERLQPQFHILDLGAGAGILPEMNFRGLAANVCGVDPDPRVEVNPNLDDGRIGMGEQIPYPDGSFDMVLADNVLEHLANPDAVFKEVRRVLKPGGKFVFKTPNWLHYMALISYITPHAFHAWFNKLRGRQTEDTFPTTYLVNTPARASAVGMRAGFKPGQFQLLENRPEYLRISALTYLVGICYERLVNSTAFLKHFRIVMIGELIADDVSQK